MRDLVMLLAVVAVFGPVLVVLWRMAGWVRRRGVGGAVVGPAEEIWHPNAREYRFVIEAQDERMAPRPETGGRPEDGPPA
ncbi:hypothetical protein [Actinocatenispora rupis]|uniref:Uncharacterized protein n=1 Tax=Actinocatenispora rupis TaxID=519421 RepID=A0A8J3J4T7_9ACTN|nr:hypothetical protein [Actinocatenispora rupis]GID14730.1 hypothetical protein Aru02nite_56190 [Actinocatenispora rupis]